MSLERAEWIRFLLAAFAGCPTNVICSLATKQFCQLPSSPVCLKCLSFLAQDMGLELQIKFNAGRFTSGIMIARITIL